jgi:hypothetical protein
MRRKGLKSLFVLHGPPQDPGAVVRAVNKATDNWDAVSWLPGLHRNVGMLPRGGLR